MNLVRPILLSICFALFLYPSLSYSQTHEIDSLLKIVNEADEDTVVINALLLLSDRFAYNPEKQLDYLEKALTLSYKNKFKSGQGKALSGLGVYYTNQGDFEKALLYLNEALVIFKEANMKDMEAAVLGNQGNVWCYKGDFEKGLDCFLKALDVMYEIGNKSWIATTKNNIGSLYTLLEEDSVALIYYKDALGIYKEINDENGMSLAIGNLANLYNAQGKHELAIENYLEAVALDEKTGNTQQLAINCTNLGKAYGDINDYENAVKYLEKAVDNFKNTGNKNGLSAAFFTLSDFYKKNKEFKKSRNYLDQSFKLAVEIGSKHSLMGIYKELAYHDSLDGNFFSAYENYKKYSLTRDSIFNAEKSDQISELQIKFDTERKEKDNEILREKNARIESENQRKSILLISGIVALALMSILVGFVIRTSRIRKRINKELQEKNFEINQQKEEISTQNDALHQQNIKIERDHKKITDSINYAGRIQEAMLPAKSVIDGFLPENFIFLKARDIVSGDFYWIKEVKKHLIIAAADCTGHGVPGALVSMLGMSLLNDIVNKDENISAKTILENLRAGIKVALKQTGNLDEQKDGMDMGLCAINLETETMEFSGANIPLYMFRNKELTIFKPVSNPIGISYKEISFDNYEIKLQDDDIFYMFSDGLVDQFHHGTKEKFKTTGLKELLESIHLRPMKDQYDEIEAIYKELTGDLANQTDDILVMGFKIT